LYLQLLSVKKELFDLHREGYISRDILGECLQKLRDVHDLNKLDER